jgi:nitrogen fixation-related uncharacterized protein
MIELIVSILFIGIVVFFWPVKGEDVYTYVEEKDEDGNIIEKVVDKREQE